MSSVALVGFTVTSPLALATRSLTACVYRQVRADFTAFEADLHEGEASVEASGDGAPLLAALRRYLDHRGLAIDWTSAETAPSDALILCRSIFHRLLPASGWRRSPRIDFGGRTMPVSGGTDKAWLHPIIVIARLDRAIQ